VNYLVDTSALVRILRRQVDESWHEQVAHGMVAICEPVLVEVLTIARATDYERVKADLLEAYPGYPFLTERGMPSPVCRPNWQPRASTKDFRWPTT
jgi:predicted nucleic acid-binding protein